MYKKKKNVSKWCAINSEQRYRPTQVILYNVAISIYKKKTLPPKAYNMKYDI